MFDNRPERARGAAALLVALAAGLAGVLSSYLAAGLTPSFVVSPVSAALVRVLPDPVVRFAITTLTGLGRSVGIDHLGATANLLLAAGLVTALLGGAAAVGVAVAGRAIDGTGRRPGAGVVLGGALVATVGLVLTNAPVPSLAAGAGAGAVLAVAAAGGLGWSSARTGAGAGTGTVTAGPAGRRRVLGGLAALFGGGVAATTALTAEEGASTAELPDLPIDGGTTAALLDDAAALDLGVDGLEGLVSGDDFYTVDINNADPDLDAGDWSLSVSGAVANAVDLDYADLLDREVVHRFVTLRCVSDPLNGRKMDTDLWSGVPVGSLLSEADPQGEYVVLRAADGYYEEFPLSAFEGGLLAHAKGGERLPRKHGYPVRTLVPGHWGEVNVKWLTGIEIHEEPITGFWEKKGWHGTGPVRTVAKLHEVSRGDGTTTVAGHAYAGTRGVERVEVSTDGGDSWAEATLSERMPAGSDRPDADGAADAWRQWSYEYDAPDGRHEVVVRAVDGTGTVQPEGDGEPPDGDRKPFPSGAVGWVSKSVEP
jgi:DMSO/TMAO reductase YedYZ molybdopterin-dependent catalytic subunit